MEFRILGPLEIRDGAGPVETGAAKVAGLLGALLLRANEIVPADRLIGDLWGESPPASAGKLLQGYVCHLRKRLSNESIVTRAGGYLIQVDTGRLDTARFRRLAAEGAALLPGDPGRAARMLREALSLWRGDVLEGLELYSSARHELEWWGEQRLASVEQRMAAELILGSHAAVTGELRKLVADHPYRENLRRQLMLALYRCGRQAEALEVYRSGSRILADELGVEPGAPLRDLELRILRHDPGLDMVAAETAPSANPPRLNHGSTGQDQTPSRSTAKRGQSHSAPVRGTSACRRAATVTGRAVKPAGRGNTGQRDDGTAWGNSGVIRENDGTAWGAYLHGGQVMYGQMTQLVPQGAIGQQLGGILGNLGGGLFGQPGIGQQLGSTLGSFLPFAAGPQIVPPQMVQAVPQVVQATPQFVPQGAIGQALGGILGNVGGGLLGHAGLGEQVGRTLGGWLPFAAGPQIVPPQMVQAVPQVVQATPQFVPQGAIGQALGGILGNVGGGLLGHAGLGEQVGRTLGGWLPFAAGPQMVQTVPQMVAPQTVPQAIPAETAGTWPSHLGISNWPQHQPLSSYIAYAAAPQVAPQLAPQGIFGAGIGSALGGALGGVLGNRGLGSTIGGIAGGFLPFQAGPQLVTQGVTV